MKNIVKHIVPEKVLFYCLFIATAVIIVLGVFNLSMYKNSMSFINRDFRLQQLSSTIIHLDEVLTMSVRLGAVTGDLHWEERYRKFESQLDSAITELQSISPEAFITKNAELTDSANIYLVKIEHEAFGLIREGKRDSAAALVWSDEYKNLKAIYLSGITNIADSLDENAKTQVQKYRNKSLFSLSFFLISLIMVGVVWLVAYNILKKYNAGKNHAEKLLKEQNEIYLRLNNELQTEKKKTEESEQVLLYKNEEYETTNEQLNQTIEELVEAQNRTREDQQKLQEQKEEIELNNSRLESLLRISQFKTDSIQELLDFALQEAIELTGSKIGYIYFYDEAKRQFTLNTWSKEVMKECAVMDPQTIYNLDSTGCWGEAVRQRKPIIINDYLQDDPMKKGTPEGHVKLMKFLTIPVIFDGKIVAVTGVANKQTDYDDTDIRQLTLLMDNVWKVSERINLIENLKIAKEKAEESERLKSAFLANMSHEIRTPMNGILGFADLLKEPDLSGEEQQNYVSIIEKSGERMLSIINDIINISKIESGLMEVNMQESNVNEQMEYIYTFFKPEVETKGVQFLFHNSLPSNQAILKTDREKLYAVLTNLVKNAIKFTPEGSIEFGYIHKPEKVVDGEKVIPSELEFYVKDTGVGIPFDRQEAIFQRFIQADPTDKNAFQGAGLGLAISKAYVEMLGGTLWVESEIGKGSCFYFTLPCNKSNEQKSVVQKQPASPVDSKLEKLKILIAEDDEISEKYISAAIQNYAKEIIRVKSGSEAVEACLNNPDIDLVLMDIQMPKMDGYEASKQIRKFNRKIVIISQTAYALEGDREKALAAGCNDYLAKPIKTDELKTMIKKYFPN